MSLRDLYLLNIKYVIFDVGAMIFGAIVVGAMIVGAISVKAMIVGAMIVRAMIVGAMIVGTMIVRGMKRPLLHHHSDPIYPLYILSRTIFSVCRRVSYFSDVKYFTAIGGLSVSLCVKSVRNQHIFLQKQCEAFVKIRNSMTFPLLFTKFSFSMTFPGLDLIFSFSMVFHDFP